MDQVLRCGKCGRVFSSTHIQQGKCPVCDLAMANITGTQRANEFVSTMHQNPPSGIHRAYMTKRLSTLDGK
jgi:phage FluMu protein Com